MPKFYVQSGPVRLIFDATNDLLSPLSLYVARHASAAAKRR